MKYYKLLMVLVLVVSLFGCAHDKQAEVARPQTEPVLPRQDYRTQSTSWEVEKDISRLPAIIMSVSKELGIELKQEKMSGRYIFTGISPSGFDVTVEAISILKDFSFLRVSIRGKQEDIVITRTLMQKIAGELRNAVR